MLSYWYMFRIERPSKADLAAFYEDGYAVFPDVLTDEGREGLTAEILRCAEVVDFLQMADAERGRLSKPHRLSVIGWNDKGPFADQLFDAPLVTALLSAVLGEVYHFCHSTIRISMRGSLGLGFHQDNLPTDTSEIHKGYIQMLYYPNGFTRGDAGLSVIPGSHRIDDWGEYAPYGPLLGVATPQLLDERFGRQAGRRLEVMELSLPPGSMVFMNARVFHAVAPKPVESPQEMRLFANYIFKEPGAPHPKTQVIPPEWLARAGTARRRLFDRPAHAGCE